jgi:hypothetical protein
MRERQEIKDKLQREEELAEGILKEHAKDRLGSDTYLRMYDKAQERIGILKWVLKQV